MYTKEVEMVNLSERIKELELKRKNREITAKEFYFELLQIVEELTATLKGENIDENQIRRQIPLILTFLKAQIKNLEMRNN